MSRRREVFGGGGYQPRRSGRRTVPQTFGRRPMRRRPARRGYGKIRLLIAAGMIGFALISFFSKKEFNEVTGETQYISLTPEQEIALGLQAMPQMVQQHGGHNPDESLQDFIDAVGFQLVQSSVARDTGWQFEFHLLDDDQTVNAFALPGGQVFITDALYNRLETKGQLAGVLGHEIGHVLARHSAQRMAKANLTRGVIGSVVIAAGGGSEAQVAQMIGQMINMKYGRNDELQSDALGVEIMSDAGYDPNSLKGVMRILAEASGGARQPEFMSTHPSPDNRIEQIDAAIQKRWPNGVPRGLEQ